MLIKSSEHVLPKNYLADHILLNGCRKNKNKKRHCFCEKKSRRSYDYEHLHALIKLKGLVSEVTIGVVDLIYFCKSLFFKNLVDYILHLKIQ